ncbi:MAG: triosephosphate isomerase [Paracoccaceae bacterium]|nr:MAG: triosephosphate isomerase [Paracoccaceae bacterium]
MRRKLIAGNWKMNGLSRDLVEVERLRGAIGQPEADILICPPATLIARMVRIAEGAPFAIGGQDCHWAPAGAHTGDISARMLADAGATAVILGHSERRADHGETSELVARKVAAARQAGLLAIVCVGETEAERDAGRTLEVVGAQLRASLPPGVDPRGLAVAYEPVWAIGSGRTPTRAEIAAVHEGLRATLAASFGPAAEGMRILYGGSVKPGNAAEILALPGVDGALVGGASLRAEDFAAIIAAA